MNNIKSILNYFYSLVKTFFTYDISRTAIFEFVFAIFIALLIYLKYIELLNFDIKGYVIILFLLWAFLAMQGFFIPIVKEDWTIGINGKSIPNAPAPIGPGIPLNLRFEARGGFIAGRKIHLKLSVLQLDKNHDTKKEFQEVYDNCAFAFFNSIAVPIKIGKFLEGQPEAGGIEVTKSKLKVRSTIIFSSPGEYVPFITFHKTGDPKNYGDKLPQNFLNHKLVISPAENWVSLRNYAITYALTLVILFLTIIQLKLL